jgi:hypothetical protein
MPAPFLHQGLILMEKAISSKHTIPPSPRKPPPPAITSTALKNTMEIILYGTHLSLALFSPHLHGSLRQRPLTIPPHIRRLKLSQFINALSRQGAAKIAPLWVLAQETAENSSSWDARSYDSAFIESR